MEFFLLFIFNIFTGAVIYLILSLKIERTSATFQEQKLKKEMGEIITEFNSTAERNITLLESRINIMKRLLSEKGDLRGIDLVVDDGKIKPGKSAEIKSELSFPGQKPVSSEIPTAKKSGTLKSTVKNDGSILVGIIDKISSITRDIAASSEIDKKVQPEREPDKNNIKYNASTVDFIEDSDIDIPGPVTDDIGSPGSIKVQYESMEDLALLFSNTPDKYTLIADLHGKGYSIEDLSRYSGLPSGEVRLVISLNR